MALYSDTFRDTITNAPIAGVLVTVTDYAGKIATLKNGLGAEITNPFLTGADGGVVFNVDDGKYNITYSYGGRVLSEVRGIVIGTLIAAIDPSPANAGKFVAFDANGNPTFVPGTGTDSSLRTNLAASTGATLVGVTGGGSAQDKFTAYDTFNTALGNNGTDLVYYKDPGTDSVKRQTTQMLAERGVSVNAFGAVGNGTINDYPACLLAFAAAKARGVPLYIPAGRYKWDLSSIGTAVWDPTILVRGARRAIPIIGAGMAQTVIDIQNATTTAWQIKSSIDWFDLCLAEFTILGNLGGTLLKLGDDSYSDPINMMDLQNISCENSANSATAEGIRMNYIAGGHCRGVRSVCYADGLGNNNGTALLLRQAEFTSFVGGAFGNANIGVDFKDGVSLGCTFVGQTLENTNIAINHRSASSGGHVFMGSQITENTQFGIKSSAMLADKLLTVYGHNYAVSPTFTSAKMIDPGNLMGVRVVDRAGVATPAVPASTVAVTNATGRTVTVTAWGGTVSQYTVRGLGIGVSNANPVTFILAPGDAISWTGSAPPTWSWSNIG